MSFESVVWEWSDRRGLEHLQLAISTEETRAEGLVVLDSEGGVIRFRYSLLAGSNGELQRCVVFVGAGRANETVDLAFDARSSWSLNGRRLPGLEKCIGFDILDTPFPKTLIVRNLNLEVGQSKDICVAHIGNRNVSITPLQQNWERLAPNGQGYFHYRCTASGIGCDYVLGDDLLVHHSRELLGQEREFHSRPIGRTSAQR